MEGERWVAAAVMRVEYWAVEVAGKSVAAGSDCNQSWEDHRAAASPRAKAATSYHHAGVEFGLRGLGVAAAA